MKMDKNKCPILESQTLLQKIGEFSLFFTFYTIKV